jgi:hypothetical protein
MVGLIMRIIITLIAAWGRKYVELSSLKILEFQSDKSFGEELPGLT